MSSPVPSSLQRAPWWPRPGEHIVITGKTGSGKSAFARALLSRRPLIFLRSKPDDLVWAMDRRATTQRTALEAMDDPRVRRLEVAPPREHQGDVYAAVLAKAYQQSLRSRGAGWPVCVDEGYRFHQLGLMGELEEIATQGRSIEMSLITCTQRPVWVSRFLLSEPEHHISFRCEGRDARTLRECVADSHYEAVRRLGKYQCAWTHGQPPQTWVGSLQDLSTPHHQGARTA